MARYHKSRQQQQTGLMAHVFLTAIHSHLKKGQFHLDSWVYLFNILFAKIRSAHREVPFIRVRWLSQEKARVRPRKRCELSEPLLSRNSTPTWKSCWQTTVIRVWMWGLSSGTNEARAPSFKCCCGRAAGNRIWALTENQAFWKCVSTTELESFPILKILFSSQWWY